LLWLARRYVNTREEAEDIVQEALLKAFRHLAKFRGESRMSTWLSVIVLNVGREWIRSRKEPSFLPLEYLRDEGDEPVAIDLPDPCLDPEQSCECREMEKILHAEIERLSSACKNTIKMCTFDGLSYLEAANALDVSVYTIKSRIFHAKRILKRRLCLRAGLQLT
jgi:RNA polymerase sigma-70 factor (ECF subfamily)